jgi:hypothetical protein
VSPDPLNICVICTLLADNDVKPGVEVLIDDIELIKLVVCADNAVMLLTLVSQQPLTAVSPV